MQTITKVLGNSKVELSDGTSVELEPRDGVEFVPGGILFASAYFLPGKSFPLDLFGSYEEFTTSMEDLERDRLMGCDRASTVSAMLSMSRARRAA
ncbi:MAG: hypothetical protein ACYCTE_10390 [Acidimicrobiales bacterium]